MTYKVKSLLTPFEDRLAASIKDILSSFEKPAYKLLYKVQPSVFLKKEWVDDPRLKKAFFEGVIAIAVVEDKPKDAHLLVAVIDKGSDYSTDVSDLLNEFKIPNICCDIQADIDSVKAYVQRKLVMLRSTSIPITRGQGNISEKWLAGQVRMAFERFNRQVQKVRPFHEPCLAEFIDVPLSDRHLSEFANKSRVDCLLTGPAPDFKPLLVLEIDGPDHEKENVKNNDRKKESILFRSKVPLVRLRLKDMPFDLRDFEGKVIELSKGAEKIAYERVFSEIIGNILSGILVEKCDVPEIWSNHDEKKMALLHKLATEYRKKNQTLRIPIDVLSEMEESIDEELVDKQYAAMGDEHALRSMLKEGDGRDKLLTFTGSTIDDLVIDEKGASATLNAPNGKWFIKIAPVHVKYVGEDLNGFQEEFDSLVPKWLAGMVCQAAEAILISEKVPELISEEQLQVFKTYWRRKWSPSEKNILATMVNDGTSFGDMAKRLDRSEYVISIALRQRNRDAFKQWNIDAPILLKLEFDEAIRCVQNGIIPKLG